MIAIVVGVKQGCIMLPWLFSISMDGYMREMKAKVGIIGAKLKLNGMCWSLVASVCR